MIYEVAIGDRVLRVAVVRKGGVLHVDLDGRTHIVDASRIGDAVVSLLVQQDGGAARSVDASFAAQPARRGHGENGAAGDFDVHLDGRTIAVQIRPAGSFGRQKSGHPAAAAAGPQRVTAAFVQKLDGPVDDLLMPLENTLSDVSITWGVTMLPHLRDFVVQGPLDVTGVSDTPSRLKIFSCRPTAKEL